VTGAQVGLAIQPQSPGLSERIWWGSGTRQTAVWAAEQGMNLMSSTLLTEDTGVSFGELQAEQIQLFREAWAEAGWERTPRVSVSRSVLPIVTTRTGPTSAAATRKSNDQLGQLEGVIARFGRSYTGEPDQIAAELARDPAVAAADTLLLTVPNQLGVEYCTTMLRNDRPAHRAGDRLGAADQPARLIRMRARPPAVRPPAVTRTITRVGRVGGVSGEELPQRRPVGAERAAERRPR